MLHRRPRLHAYEFKYRGNNLSRGAHSFTAAYQTEVKLVNTDNYLDFLTLA